MKETRTHWRTFFPSDYLGGADLDTMDQVLTLTVEDIEKKVDKGKGKNGKDEIFLIAHWKEDFKPMIVNVGNSKVLIDFSGSIYVEDWPGSKVDVFFDPNVTYMGEVTGGLRFKQQQPQEELNLESIEYSIKQINNCEDIKELNTCFDNFSKALRKDKRVKNAATAKKELLNKTKN